MLTLHRNLFLVHSAIVKETKGNSAEKARCSSSNNFSHFADFKELGEKYVARDASGMIEMQENQGTYANLVTPDVSMSWHGHAVG